MIFDTEILRFKIAYFFQSCPYPVQTMKVNLKISSHHFHSTFSFKVSEWAK